MKKGNYYFNQDVEKLFKKYMEITKRSVYEQLPAWVKYYSHLNSI
jgi:hypothetical protein